MTTTTLDELRAAWPGRITLRADEVALVLRGKQTKKVVERIRSNMKAGAYGEGARKVDGVWQLPLTDLANVISPPPPTPAPVDAELLKRNRRRSKIGPRLTFVIQGRFWASVLKAMGEVEEASRLDYEATETLEGLRCEDRERRARRLQATFKEGLENFWVSQAKANARYRAI